MEELMKDLGVTDFKELIEYMKENPENQIVLQLKEIIEEN